MLRLFVILLSIISFTTIYSEMLGPVNFLFKSFENCEEVTNVIDFSITQRKHNRTVFVLDIEVESPYDIGSQTELELKGSVYKDGGWKPGSFYMKNDDVCETMAMLMGDPFMAALKAAGVDNCPFPQGKSTISDYVFDNNKFTIPQVYGDYKMIFIVWIGDEIQACYVAYYEFVPKNKFSQQ